MSKIDLLISAIVHDHGRWFHRGLCHINGRSSGGGALKTPVAAGAEVALVATATAVAAAEAVAVAAAETATTAAMAISMAEGKMRGRGDQREGLGVPTNM